MQIKQEKNKSRYNKPSIEVTTLAVDKLSEKTPGTALFPKVEKLTYYQLYKDVHQGLFLYNKKVHLPTARLQTGRPLRVQPQRWVIMHIKVQIGTFFLDSA